MRAGAYDCVETLPTSQSEPFQDGALPDIIISRQEDHALLLSFGSAVVSGRDSTPRLDHAQPRVSAPAPSEKRFRLITKTLLIKSTNSLSLLVLEKYQFKDFHLNTIMSTASDYNTTIQGIEKNCIFFNSTLPQGREIRVEMHKAYLDKRLDELARSQGVDRVLLTGPLRSANLAATANLAAERSVLAHRRRLLLSFLPTQLQTIAINALHNRSHFLSAT